MSGTEPEWPSVSNPRANRRTTCIVRLGPGPRIVLAVASLAAIYPIRQADAKHAGHAAGTTAVSSGVRDRDWKQHPAIVEIKPVADLYALGDVHGDYDRLVDLLTVAKLISGTPATPEAVKWSGGHAVLVCTGDFIDKYHAVHAGDRPAAGHAG